MNIEDILDKLDDTVEEAWTLPLTKGKRVLDAEKIQELIEDIRLNVPSEIKQARNIVSDRQDIVENARKEAESIVNKAKSRAEVLLEESDIMKEAKKRAKEIIDDANKNSREIKKVIMNYSESVLRSVEEQLSKNIQDIRKAAIQIKSIE